MLKQFEKKLGEMNGLVNEENWSAYLLSAEFPVVLLAVSGGVDSMVMADLFLRFCGPGAFAVAHCNFHLRGEDSDEDQELVRTWTESSGVKFYKADFDTIGYANRHDLSIEMAARDLRYNWFAQICKENGYLATSVAHNANDNAETLVLNLLRGTGVEGLKGMKPVSDFPVSGVEGVKLIRPLLSFTRKQIEGYAFARGVKYRDDQTNFESDYKRNRIRNEVFPHFFRINPSFVRTFNQEMSYFSEVGQIVENWCENSKKDVTSYVSGPLGKGLRIDIEALKSKQYRKYLLYYILYPYAFNSSVLASIEDLLQSQRTIPGKRFEADEYVLIVGRGEMTVYSRNKVDINTLSKGDHMDIMPVRGDGVYHFNGRAFKVETVQWKKGMPLKQPEGVVMADASKLKFPFVLRKWRPGDWMIPLGMKGRKLLSDMFTDMKYDLQQKTAAVVAVDVATEGMAEAQHIISLACLRIDEGYKVSSSTEKVIRISCVEE